MLYNNSKIFPLSAGKIEFKEDINMRILVVEDEKTLCETIAKGLRQIGRAHV